VTAGHNPASPRVGGALILRCTGLIGQPRIAYRPNRLPVTRRVMTYILEIGDRRRLKGVSAFSTTQAHRPSGTLLRWEVQFRRRTAQPLLSPHRPRKTCRHPKNRKAKETVHPCSKYCRKGKAYGNSSTAHTPVI